MYTNDELLSVLAKTLTEICKLYEIEPSSMMLSLVIDGEVLTLKGTALGGAIRYEGDVIPLEELLEQTRERRGRNGND